MSSFRVFSQTNPKSVIDDRRHVCEQPCLVAETLLRPNRRPSGEAVAWYAHQPDLLHLIRLSISYLSVHLGFTCFESLNLLLTVCSPSLQGDIVILCAGTRGRCVDGEGHSNGGTAVARSPAMKITRSCCFDERSIQNTYINTSV